MKKLGFLGLVLLLVLSSVHARIIIDTYSLDYVTSSTDEGLKICSCATKSDYFRIQNVEDFDAAYRVGIRSDVKDWFGVSDQTFALQPGQKKDIQVFINIPCNALSGSYAYTIMVASNHDGMKEISRSFEVVHCQNLGFEVVPQSMSVKPCAAAGFQAKVQNVGLFSDRFTLSSDSDKVSFSEPSVMLKPQELKTIYGYYAVSCSATSDVEVPITLSSSNNEMSSTKTLSLRVQKPLYDWNIQSQKLSLCAEVPEKIGVSVVNSHDAPLDYELNVKDLSFAQAEPATGSLARNAQGQASIVFHPKKDDIGKFDAFIGFKTSLDKDYDYKSLQVEVQDCHGFSGKFTDVSNEMCCGEKTLVLNIRNQGSDQDTFNVFSSDVKVLDASIALRPGENGNVRVLWNAPCQDQDHLIRVTVVPVSRPELSEDVTLPVKVLSQESCYQPGLGDEPLVLRKDAEKLTINIKNLGIEPAMYKLKLSSPFLALPFMDLYLEPGQVKEIPLRVGDVSNYAPGNYVSDLVLSPKDTSVEYTESLQLQLAEAGLFAQDWKPFLVIVVILVLALAIWQITRQLSKKSVKRRR